MKMLTTNSEVSMDLLEKIHTCLDQTDTAQNKPEHFEETNTMYRLQSSGRIYNFHLVRPGMKMLMIISEKHGSPPKEIYTCSDQFDAAKCKLEHFQKIDKMFCLQSNEKIYNFHSLRPGTKTVMTISQAGTSVPHQPHQVQLNTAPEKLTDKDETEATEMMKIQSADINQQKLFLQQVIQEKAQTMASSSEVQKKHRSDACCDQTTENQNNPDEVNLLRQFLRDIHKEEVWIKKKKGLVASEDYDHDLSVVQNLRNEHTHIESELASREPNIHALWETCARLQTESILITDDIRDRLQGLFKKWDQLKYMVINRRRKLDESLVFQQCASNVKKGAWINKIQQMKWSNFPKMGTFIVFFMCLIGAASQLEISGSYTTSFRCSNGSYALIRGDNLILEFEYGYKFSELYSFHLYELIKGRHMFDYERLSGQAFIKDNRLKSYNLTDTGIKLMIPDINREMDLGKYEADVDNGPDYKQKSVEITEIFDPPSEVKINTPTKVAETVYLNKGFGEYILEASAESYTASTCSSVMVMWVSQTKGGVLSCQAKDETSATVCPLTLKESEMTAGECITLEVYAEHYGVRSENKTFTICYSTQEYPSPGTQEYPSPGDGYNARVLHLSVFGIFLLMIIVATVVFFIYITKRGQNHRDKEEGYKLANQVAESKIQSTGFP